MADLTGANLTDARLSTQLMQGTQYNKATRWPAGFVPPLDANLVT